MKFKLVHQSGVFIYQVYDNIFMEGVPPLGCYAAHIHHSLRVVGVDVKDGGIDHPSHIRRVWR